MTRSADSGGASDVRLLSEAFDPGALLNQFAAAHPGHGGLASFTGQVRAEGDVLALELSHYAPMTLPGMEALAAQTHARFALLDAQGQAKPLS